MKRAVGRSALEESVLPTARIVAGLALAVLDVLAEIDSFLGRDVKTDRRSQIFEGQLAIFVLIKPVEELANLLFGRNKAPMIHQLHETRIMDVILRWHSPLIKDTL